MANWLEMANIQAILRLKALHWSNRRIAEHLEIDRATVTRHLKRHAQGANAAISPPGSEVPNAATLPDSPGPRANVHDSGSVRASPADPNAAISPSGSDVDIRAPIVATGPAAAESAFPRGRPGLCEPFREAILEKLRQQLSARRIYQDLAAEQGYRGSYDSVKRFVRRLAGALLPLPMRRLECAPGLEAQVDYGSGIPIVGPDGKRRTTHVFRIVLSHSRKGYSEVCFRQTTDDFLCALENSFWHFGGVPRTIVIDNLKAAVKQADWYDPELQPKVRSFCEHYATAILPARPYMPRHKGKVERGIGYVKNNALKGHSFHSLEEQNIHLQEWERSVADTRLHGTTRQHVGEVFRDVERPALLPLPAERFPSFHEAQRIVNRDGHIEVAKAYYSVPPEYLARTVWVRWDARLVRVFNQRMEQVALHVRHEPGRFSTHGSHIVREKISGIERGAKWLMNKVSLIGPQSKAWAQALLVARGIEGTRVLMGLIALTNKHPSTALEQACKTALSHGEFRLRAIRALIAREPERVQAALPFLEEHPLIRPLDDYASIVAAAVARTAQTHSTSGGESTVRFKRYGRANEFPGDETTSDERKSPGGSDRQGLREIHPPGSGYSSPGCAPAEPGSASPDSSSIRSLFPPFPPSSGEISDAQ